MRLLRTYGFTLVEVLVVLGLVLLIAGFIVTGFQNYSRYQNYDYAVGAVRIALQESQSNATHSVGGVAHGIKVGTSSVTIFEGTTYSAVDPNNTVIDVYDVTLSHSLTGGTDEIVFALLSGLPTATGTITVVGTTYVATTTLTITDLGGIE